MSSLPLRGKGLGSDSSPDFRIKGPVDYVIRVSCDTKRCVGGCGGGREVETPVSVPPVHSVFGAPVLFLHLLKVEGTLCHPKFLLVSPRGHTTPPPSLSQESRVVGGHGSCILVPGSYSCVSRWWLVVKFLCSCGCFSVAFLNNPIILLI